MYLVTDLTKTQLSGRQAAEIYGARWGSRSGRRNDPSREPYHPGFVAEWAADWQDAWEAAAGVVPDQKQRLAYREQATSQRYRLLRRDENWAALAAITDELLAHETIEGEQVEEIMQRWLP